jgi:sphingosine kinase
MKYLIIANPISGKRKSISILKNQIIPHLKTQKINFESFITEYPSHAKKKINTYDLNEIERIIVLGGDGTMHEVINGMLSRNDDKNIPIGLLPTGSGNSLIHDLNQLDIKNTLNTILTDRIQKVDLLKITTPNEELFSINMIGWGMVNDIGYQAENLRWMGPMRYNVSSIMQIFKYLPRKANIEIDGECYGANFAFIMICNTIHVGKGMKMAPKASLKDGKMDLIIIENNFSRIKLLQMFPKLFNGSHINSKLVKYKKAKSFKLYPEVNEKLNIDGDMNGITPITVTVESEKMLLLN